MSESSCFTSSYAQLQLCGFYVIIRERAMVTGKGMFKLMFRLATGKIGGLQ